MREACNNLHDDAVRSLADDLVDLVVLRDVERDVGGRHGGGGGGDGRRDGEENAENAPRMDVLDDRTRRRDGTGLDAMVIFPLP